MNILGRVAYFFSVLAGYFVSALQWFANQIKTNLLLSEIFKIMGFLIIALLFVALIRWLLSRFWS